MKLIDRLMLGEILPRFGMAILAFILILILAGPLKMAGQWLSRGVPFTIAMQLIGVNIPIVIGYTLPVALLFGVQIAMGRLSSDSESVALYAGGIPFVRILAPVFVLGLIVAGVGYWINDRITPRAILFETHLKNTYIGEGSTDALRSTGPSESQPVQFALHPHGNLETIVYSEGGVDLADLSMRKVYIVYVDQAGMAVEFFQADRATWVGGDKWKLTNSRGFQLTPGGAMAETVKGVLEPIQLDITPQNASFLGREPTTLDFSELQTQIAQMKANKVNRSQILASEADLWWKIALPFSALVFAIVGTALGFKGPRSAKAMAFVLPTVIVFLYYVLYTTMNVVAIGGHLSPALAMFLPNIVGLVTGAVLVIKASRS